MSRCFPYPPPGFCGKRLYDEALIESVKLQREREKAKAKKKKEKRREKKEKKRREEKEKAEFNPSETSTANKLEKNSAYYGAGHIERSDLTEEHELPIDSNNPCNSTDSTQNSNKRKKNDSVSTGIENIGSGSFFDNEMLGLDWVFPPLKPEVDDLEWLFRRKFQDRNKEKRFKSGSEVSSCGSEVFWPRAQYLAEADIYKLPYTIPF